MSSPSIPLRLLAASAALLVLAGCASSEPTSDAAASAQATAAESQTSGNAGLESAQTAVPEANGSEYGAERLHLALGEQGGWTYANTDDLAFGVAITNMTWDPVCDGDMYMAVESPANGRYVELTMEITTATDYVSALGHEMAVFWNDWVSETADGRLVDNSSSSLTCLPMEAGFPAGPLAPGFQQTARFVVDVPEGATTIAWNPKGDGGLSWDLPVA